MRPRRGKLSPVASAVDVAGVDVPLDVVVVVVDVEEAGDDVVVVAVVGGPVSLAVAGGALLVVAAEEEEEPDAASFPQPASASAAHPNKAIPAIRPDPNTRPTFLIQSNPRLRPSMPVGAHEVLNQGIARDPESTAAACYSSHEAIGPPRQPRCRRLGAVRPEVLRPRLSTGLPLRGTGSIAGAALCNAGRVPANSSG
jgi:hypothetical protein